MAAVLIAGNLARQSAKARDGADRGKTGVAKARGDLHGPRIGRRRARKLKNRIGPDAGRRDIQEPLAQLALRQQSG